MCNYYKKIVVDKKRSKITKNHLMELTEMGFDWKLEQTKQVALDVGNEIFEARTAQLRKVSEVCGNCNNKNNISSVYPDCHELLLFMSFTRAQYHKHVRG
jgi:hypothetical protein